MLTITVVKYKVCLKHTIDTMGSKSLFSSTSVQVISMAPGALGEQGVKRSSTITLGSSRAGPRT